MRDINDFTNPELEPEHRFCPICDVEIHPGSTLHQCSKKRLKEIEKKSKLLDEVDDYDLEDERSYDDKLTEYKNYYDNENYYDIEEEEEC